MNNSMQNTVNKFSEQYASAWHRFKNNKPAYFSLWVFVSIIGFSIIVPVVHKSDPISLSDFVFQKPNAQFWFGTDANGRDMMARVILGLRISMAVAVAGTLISMLIGVCWGAMAGYFGGKIDSLLMRIVDILYSMPTIIFVIILVAIGENSIKKILITMGLEKFMPWSRLILLFIGMGTVSWLTMSRIVRAQVRTVKSLPFIEASISIGASHMRLIFKHIIPNCSGIIVTCLAISLPNIVLYESFLSYLGLGVQPPIASLGSLMADGISSINSLRIYWWLVVFPGIFLVSLLLTLNLIADGVRDAIDPTGSTKSLT
jgi:peptide/nickel transport system permease protein/oligopeptide transport system permease protein